MILKKLITTLSFGLVFILPSSINASWPDKIAQAVCWPYYPLQKIAEKITTFRTLNREQATFIESTQLVKKQYPHAAAHIEAELTHAGVNPSHTYLLNAPTTVSYINTLWLPFDKLEDQLTASNGMFSFWRSKESASQLSELRGSTSHEIGHLIHHDSYKDHIYPLFALGIVELVTRKLPTWHTLPTWHGTNTIIRSLAKTATAFSIINALNHIDEYRADTFTIKQFAHEPEVLNAMSLSFINHHKELFTHFFHINPFIIKKLGVYPFFWRIVHLITDEHPSSLSRAIRFAQAAGQKITQKELARATYEEVIAKLKSTEK